jgi:hypothetical protein
MGADKNRQITPPSRFPRSHRARRGRFDFPGASGRSNPTSCGHRPTAGPGRLRRRRRAKLLQATSDRARRDPVIRDAVITGRLGVRRREKPPLPFIETRRHRRAAALAKTLHRLSWQVTLLRSGRKSCPSSPIDLELLEGAAEPARAPRRAGRWCGQTFHGPTRACGIRRRRTGPPVSFGL